MIFESLIRNILAFAVVLGTLVVLHEGGHFLVAKLFRFPVAIFSIGFGKRIWGFRHKETDYRLSAIPLGGYVRVVGLGPDESLLAADSETEEAFREEIDGSRNRLARIAIFAAGPLANVVLAILLLAFAYMVGREVPAYLEEPVIAGMVIEESPAARVGLEVDDRIVAVDGKPIPNWDRFTFEVGVSGGQTLSFDYERDGERRSVDIPIEKMGTHDVGYIGILPRVPMKVTRVAPDMPAGQAGLEPGDIIVAIDGQVLAGMEQVSRLVTAAEGRPTPFVVERDGSRLELSITPEKKDDKVLIGIEYRHAFMATRRLAVGAAFEESLKENLKFTVMTFDIVGRLFRAKAPVKQMSGPLEIARFAGEESRQGPAQFIAFMAMVSLQLAIFNILPIPLLDGFHILLIGVEGILRRDLSLEVKERIFQVGFMFLVLLMLVVLYNDVLKSVPSLKSLFGG